MHHTTLDPRQFARMTKVDLIGTWAEVFGKEPPVATSRELLAMALAWEVQARRHGGLRPALRRRLRALARGQPEGVKSVPASSVAAGWLCPGTTLVRDWRGCSYTVLITVDGFVFEDRTYKSLSEIARRITGTRWNGPAFFGLRGGQPIQPTEQTSDGR